MMAAGLIIIDFSEKPAFDELSIHADKIKAMEFRTYLVSSDNLVP